MENNSVFNATVCIIGIAIFLIHIINILIKKNRRKDENYLLAFLSFTAFHFAVYLTFTFLKDTVKNEAFIVSFYTTFYIFNNIELLLLFLYTLCYVKMEKGPRKALSIVNYVLFGIFVVSDLVNVFTGIYFTGTGGVYNRTMPTMFISQGYQLVMFIIVFIITVFHRKLLLREKIAFAVYCLLPLVAIILQDVFKGYAIAYASIIISIEVLFFFVNVSKNIQIVEEQEKNKEAQIRVMMSQIQPHFIYNSLSSISTLISIDPKKAQKALDNFTEYLRHNFSSLTESRLISFEDELKHVETYLALEKIRFDNRLSVVYEIQTKNFVVPPLSVQPIVENAVKHGILKKVEGGTILIRSYKQNNYYIVEIKDDGVGFSLGDIDFNDNSHIGINNIRSRLKNMCDGSVEIQSEIGRGTTVYLSFKDKDYR